MKKCKWLFAILSLVGIVMTTNITTVKAERYTNNAIWPSEHISGIYVRKYGNPNGSIEYKQMRFLRRSEDNKFVYCLQPFVEIDNHYVYNVERSDYTAVTGLSKEQWERVSLLAYYGYSYGNHKEPKWYAITQLLIWNTTTPTGRVVFTDGLNGPDNPNLYTSEIAELEALVANHKKVPQFNQTNMTMPLGSSTTITDVNGVLSNYSITSTSGVSASISGNSLTINATSIGDASITLTKSDTKYDTPPIVYWSPYTQDVFRVGMYDPITTKFNLKILGGKVTINKIDRDTGEAIPSGNAGATLSGAKFGIYDAETNELLTTVTTGTNGVVTSEILPKIGKMYALELESSTGYLINGEKVYFEITESNLNPSITVYEQIKKQIVEISKFYSQEETGILTPEVGIEFGFYNPNNELVAVIKTDKQGWGQVVMPYGDYTVKQHNASPNTEKMKDFTISIRENSTNALKYNIVNEELTAKLKVVKVDSESNKVLVRDGIKFKIKNLDTNEYVCQTITYPTQEKVCTYLTTGGTFVTPYVLEAGNYQIEELEDQVIDGYVWNSEPLKFAINDNSDFIDDEEYGLILEVEFKNQQVKGEVEVNKLGEKFIIEDNSIKYEEIKLDGVTFGLYANGDIVSQDGTLIYKDKELVSTFKTVDGYYKLSSIYLGSYCLIEEDTISSHKLDSTPYCFTLEYEDQYTPIVSLSITMKNYLKKGDLIFTKTDLTTGEVIPNTLIEIYTENDELIFSGKTNEKGEITINSLPVNRYYILEKESATGFLLSDEKVYFEITEDGEIVKAEMTNKPITGTLDFTKIDLSTSEPIPNTLIEIYTENDELIFSGRTDQDGKIVIEGIRYGKYYILEKETASPEYILNTEKMYFEITEDGQVIKAEMTNDKKIVEVPNTLNNDYMKIAMISLIGVGVVSISYGIFKKRKKK